MSSGVSAACNPGRSLLNIVYITRILCPAYSGVRAGYFRGPLCERTVRVFVRIVMALKIMGEPVIILIMVMVRIMYCVAAVVIVHICIHICLIMTQVMRPWTLEAAWVIVPMPRRSPRNVIMRVDMGVYAWSCPVYRSYYIIVAIDEWCSYNLNIVVRHRRTLHHNCSYILKYISA